MGKEYLNENLPLPPQPETDTNEEQAMGQSTTPRLEQTQLTPDIHPVEEIPQEEAALQVAERIRTPNDTPSRLTAPGLLRAMRASTSRGIGVPLQRSRQRKADSKR